MLDENTLQTGSKWIKTVAYFKPLNYNGWKSKDSFDNDLITEREFFKRLVDSTCKIEML